MTLDEAIKHAQDVADKTNCKKCKEEHQQLVIWLKELKEIKQIYDNHRTIS